MSGKWFGLKGMGFVTGERKNVSQRRRDAEEKAGEEYGSGEFFAPDRLIPAPDGIVSGGGSSFAADAGPRANLVSASFSTKTFDRRCSPA
jgi:hypothetical protein